MKNNLYLVSTEDNGFEFVAIIIVAENEKDALDYASGDKKQNEKEGYFPFIVAGEKEKMKVKFIGKTDFPAGDVILSSFNAG